MVWRVLVNQSRKKILEPFSPYGNLQIQKYFGDGKLLIDYNVPEGGNSGSYVRGAYEAKLLTGVASM